jgi:hypothetical protein
MDTATDKVYELLPVIYRLRDAEQGYPLRALLRVIAEQVDVIENDIEQLYNNWFIETAQDWVVPYIGDLIGYRPVHEAGEPGDPNTVQGDVRNKILTPRREVANTLHYRRRKGTLSLLENLANDVAGWPARAVEFFKLLGWTQNLNHQNLGRARTVDVRDGNALDLLDGPFNRIAHTVDVRRVNSTLTRGCYNIPSVGVFIWRMKSYPVTYSQACCLEKPGPHCYTFSTLGNDAPLFIKPDPKFTPQNIAEERNLPTTIRRRELEADLRRTAKDPTYSSRYYGENKSLAIWAGDWAGHEKGNDPNEPIPPKVILVADLSDWHYTPLKGQIAVDPVLGRIAFPSDQLPGRDSHSAAHRMRGVRVSYHYGFSADMGSGEYDRLLRQPADAKTTLVKNVRELAKALAPWRSDSSIFDDQPSNGVIEITESGAYTLPFHITLKAGHSLQIRAANRKRPVIRLLDYQTDLPDALYVAMMPGSRFTLDGVIVTGRPVHIEAHESVAAPNAPEKESCDNGNPAPKGSSRQFQGENNIQSSFCAGEVVIRHCTLLPGWEIEHDCEPKRLTEPSLELFNIRARVRIEHSILGSLQVNEDQVHSDPISITITDSIIDATGGEREAIGAPGCPVAHAVLTIQRCTVFGIVQVHAIKLAENSIFTNCLNVARRQLGCMRFCYVPENCRTPRRYNCQPDLVCKPILKDFAQGAVTEQEKDRRIAIELLRVAPQFTGRRYGQPGYGRLTVTCAVEIRRGADDESEMGVFHDLYTPQREANLRTRLDEYTPAGMDTGIIIET